MSYKFDFNDATNYAKKLHEDILPNPAMYIPIVKSVIHALERQLILQYQRERRQGKRDGTDKYREMNNSMNYI
jgi:hypothetical protein